MMTSFRLVFEQLGTLPVLPKAPWQMSVRVAPSTMNSGRLQNSCQVHTDKEKNIQISADFYKEYICRLSHADCAD